MGALFARTSDSLKPNDDQRTSERDLLEPVAVVGLSLKFPDDADSVESFWSMLTEGRCASQDFPQDRLNLDAFYDANPDKRGTVRPHQSLDSLSLSSLFIKRSVV